MCGDDLGLSVWWRGCAAPRRQVWLIRIAFYQRRVYRQRKPHLKPCVAGLRGHLNIASVFFHNALHRVQTQPSSLPDSFGCEEWLKDVRLDLGRNSGTVIADLDHDAIVLAIRSDSQFALSAHGIDGVIDNVGPDLIELTPE